MTHTKAIRSFRAKRAIPLSFYLALFLLTALPTSAQVQTGTPPLGSFAGGPDVINLASLNSEITASVIHRAGRGLPFNVDIAYNSTIWYPAGSSSIKNWQPVSSWGLALATPIGYVTYSVRNTVCSGTHINLDVYSNWTYVDSNGMGHPFNISTWANTSTPCTTTSKTATATDGSGYTMKVTGGGVNYVLSPDGATIHPIDYTTPLGPGSIQDRNGNLLSVDSNGYYTDTLGGVALSVSGAAPNPTTYTYTAPGTNGTGVAAAVTITYQTHTIKTNFGCGNVAEYPATNIPLVDKITLADGTFYQFAYEPTPGFSGDYTGRIASITLPTSGSISYQYSGGGTGVNGITCADGSPAILTRTTPDGTWTYNHTKAGTAGTTTVTDPYGNQTVLQFEGIYETQRQVYQGSSSSGTLLGTTTTCYNGNTSNCTGTSVTLPISQRNVTTQFGSGNLQSQHVEFYNATYGLITEIDDYDFGAGSPGPLIRKILKTYASLGNGIVDRVASTTAQDGSGHTIAQTTYCYDEGTPSGTTNCNAAGSPTPISGTPQHVSITGSRGNATTVARLVSGSNYLAKTFTYYDTGNPQTVTDPNTAATSYNYLDPTSTCGNAFPTSVSEPYGFSKSMAYNCIGVVQTSAKDENNQTTTTAYTDPYFWRPANIKFPDGGETDWTYNSQTSVTTTTKMNSSQNIVTTQLLDGLGRIKQTQLNSDLQGVDYSVMTYDAVSRHYQAYNPTRCSPPTTNCGEPTWGYTATAYDALSRPTSVTLQDGSVVSASYTNNTVTATDPAAKTRQSTVDSLGRLTQVIEDPGTSPHLNYITSYTFDALGNLTSVTQNGGRQRTFVYDAMSRLTSETNPETSTTTYKYDSDSNCASPNSFAGDLVSRTDARNIRTCFQYDALHRLTQKSYSDGTPTATFTYDVSSIDGDSYFTNTVGRLVRAATTGSSPAKTYFSYDSMGRIIYQPQCVNINCGQYGTQPPWWVVSNGYDLAGNLTSYGDPLTGTAFTQKFDSAGRPWQLTSNWVDGTHPQNLYVVGTTTQPNYTPFGAVSTALLGNGLTAAYAYNTRLQPCRMDWNTSAQSLPNCASSTPSTSILDFTFCYGLPYQSNCNGTSSTTSNNGNLSNWNATGQQSFTRSFNYDNLNRVSAMQETSGIAEGCKPASSSSNPYTITWTIDPWGNRTAQTPSTGTCSFSQSVNAQNQLLGPPYQYDSAGNMTHDALHSYTYDAENRLVAVDGGATASYLYNAEGQRVAKGVNPSWSTYYVYASDGQVISEALSNGSWNQTYLHFNGQIIGGYRGSNTGLFALDHLGSTRLDTLTPFVSTSQSVYDNMDYLPFGEQIAGGSATTHKFTGDERDSETNLDHTWFRQYSSQLGRWMHPDPAGLAAVNLSAPQTWNRYAYVSNNPLALTDPSGLAGMACKASCSGFYPPSGPPICTSLDSCFSSGQSWMPDVQYGYDIFDAIAGEPGTYISYDIYGNVGFSFSENLWAATSNFIDAADPISKSWGTGSLSTTGYYVSVHNLGVDTIISGFIPDLLAAAQQARDNQANIPLPQKPDDYDRAIREEIELRNTLDLTRAESRAAMIQIFPDMGDYLYSLYQWYMLTTAPISNVYDKYLPGLQH